MNVKYILFIIAILLFFVLSTYTKLYTSKSDLKIDGFKLMTCYKIFNLLAWSGIILIVIILLLIPISILNNDSVGYWVLLSIFIFTLPISYLSLIFYRNHKVYYNETTLIVSDFFKRTHSLNWSEIQQITYQPKSGFISFFTSNKRVKIHNYMIGMPYFIEIMEEKTHFNAQSLNIPLREPFV